ncbi:MAG: redoxin domain-containing protein [Gemmatimonadetes bacterium]|nr:redoxin domain-containing protein [Gemmatimonadota bacterium]
MRRTLFALLLLVTVAAGAERSRAQDTSSLIEVGEVAPDFELAGATRHGVLADPVRLSDYRGETVVLAFFFRVRTPG